MEELSNQLSVIVDQLKKLTDAQKEHDGKLEFLFHKIEDKPVEIETPIQTEKVRPSAVDLFRIPDPIKSIPHFDGNRKQLAAWLKTAEDTLLVFQPLVAEQQFALYIQAVLNKIEGKAKDIICLAGNPQSFLEIKEILLEALGDRQELSYYKSQLWSNKQGENTTIPNYFNKMKEIVQNIKSLARQNKFYSESWTAISAFIDEDALAAFISGLRKPYFGYAQAAKPKCIEEAYAFLCKFNSNELISGNSKKVTQNHSNFQKSNLVNQNYKTNMPNNQKRQSYSIKDVPTPMDVDQSLRSRQSFNKKMNIHSHEIDSGNQDVEDTEQEDLNTNETNFQQVGNSDTED